MKKRSFKFWTKEEVSYLKDNFGISKLSELAKHLNRNQASISVKASNLSLGKKRDINKISNNQIPIVVNGCRITIESGSKNIHIGKNSINITF